MKGATWSRGKLGALRVPDEQFTELDESQSRLGSEGGGIAEPPEHPMAHPTEHGMVHELGESRSLS